MWYILLVGDRILRYDVRPAVDAGTPGALDVPHLSVLAVGRSSVPAQTELWAAVSKDGLGGRPS